MFKKHKENPVGAFACAAGKGLFAGVVATVSMTLAQMVQMKLTGRKGSDTPARAATKVLGVSASTEENKGRFNNLVHFSYGTAWGSVRGILSSVGLKGTWATILHFLAIWITGLVLLPSIKVSSVPWKWGLMGIITDGFFHIIYAVSAALTFNLIDRRK